MIRKFFFLFVFFAPFTSFFALSAWLRIPIVINLLLFVFLIISIFQIGKINNKWLLKEDLFLIGFLILVVTSFLFGFKEKRSFNHLLAYTNAIVFYFFLSKYVIIHLSISSKEIARICYLSFITCSIIIIFDFIGKNYFDISLRNIFSTADGKISNMDYFIRFGFFRVGGVAEEPGTMSLFYNLYFGLALYYVQLKQEVKKFKWLLLLFIVSHFAMMSNAGITLPILALLMIFTINKLDRLTITKNQLFFGVATAIVIVFGAIAVFYFDVGNTAQIADEFLNKILFTEEHKNYSSSGQRLKHWGRALRNFIKNPIFGFGPGYGVEEDQEGYLSVYLTILADIGLLAFLLFIAFQEALLKKVMSLPVRTRNFLLFSVITSLLHLLIVSDFYHAPIWILFALIQLIYKEQKHSAL